MKMKKIFAAILGVLTAMTGWSQQPEPTKVKHPDWSRNAVIYEVNVRQYTPEGTFKAFMQHLPRLKDLGVDILWLMPIHPISEDGRKGELGSYYAVRDYKAVNPEFGTMDDMRELVKAAHDLGMKVIIDWVPNHSGRDNAWVDQHPDWYARNDQGEMYGPFDWTDVYQFDYTNPDLRRAMTDAMAYWLREADIDGFRCDVAGMVPVDFWNDNRKALEAVKPEIFMLAEAPDAPLLEEAFDMDYNWPMKDLFSAIAATSGQYSFAGQDGQVKTFPETHAADIYTLLGKQYAEYPLGSYMMNMITNHDLNSWEGTEFQRLGNLQGAFAVLTYTLPGMPLIYTGQEVGLDRAFEFFKKDAAPDWNGGKDYTAFYKTLNALRHARTELSSSAADSPVVPLPTASADVLAFRRGNVVTIVNLGPGEARLFDTAPDLRGMTELFTGKTSLPETLQAGGYLVYTK